MTFSLEKKETLDYAFCEKKHFNQLIKFIDEHWKADHVFTSSKALIDWQHKKNDEHYNFVLAINKLTKQIAAILGFIPTSQFSFKLLSDNEAWLAIWKVRDDTPEVGVGLFLLQFLRRQNKLKTICVLGLSQMVVPIYKALGFTVGKLEHCVLPNNNVSDFNILQLGKPVKATGLSLNKRYLFRPLDVTDLEAISIETTNAVFITRPKKNPEYLLNRYLNHPVYQYQIFGAMYGGDMKAILVIRRIQVGDSKVLRIIDYQGEHSHLQYLNQPLQQLLGEENAEYIDFMQHGISVECLTRSGFLDSNQNKDLIIPNYFEPFDKSKVILDYAYYTEHTNEKFLICKGDADQDRPNII